MTVTPRVDCYKRGQVVTHHQLEELKFAVGWIVYFSTANDFVVYIPFILTVSINSLNLQLKSLKLRKNLMLNIKTLSSISLVSASLLLSFPTLANSAFTPSSLYGGISAGHASYDLGNFEDALNDEVVFGSADFTTDDSDFAIQFYLGYQITNFIGVEAAYTDLGEVSLGVQANESFLMDSVVFDVDTNTSISLPVTTTSVALVANYPMTDDFFVKAKLGINSWELSTESTSEVTVSSLEIGLNETFDASDSEDVSESGEDNFWSLGVEYVFTRFSITGDYQTFVIDDVDVSVLSAGVKLSF